jgi:hypothetical protein
VEVRAAHCCVAVRLTQSNVNHRDFFYMNDNATIEEIATMVHYVRHELHYLASLPSLDLFGGNIEFSNFVESHATKMK